MAQKKFLRTFPSNQETDLKNFRRKRSVSYTHYTNFSHTEKPF